jgi:hypothetical protein
VLYPTELRARLLSVTRRLNGGASKASTPQDRDIGSRTTFTITPSGNDAIVTIQTELMSRGGVAGRIDRFVSTRFLRKMYRQELEKLNEVAQEVLAGLTA